MAGFEGGYAEGSFLWIVNNIYFQYYSLLIFLVSAAVMVVVSHMTEPPAEEQAQGPHLRDDDRGAPPGVARELG